MEKNYIKIFGIERSGTNYLEALIKENLNAHPLTNGLGWKHGAPVTPDEWFHDGISKEELPNKDLYIEIVRKNPSLPCVVIIKDPYHWLDSIRKFRPQNFDLVKWFKKYNSLYLEYMNYLLINEHEYFKPAIFVRYEDLLTEPEKQISKIAEVFGLRVVTDFTIPDKVFLSPKFNKKRKEFYLSPNPLDVDKLKKINDIINRIIFIYYRYDQRISSRIL